MNMSDMNKEIIILSTNRSGSTLMCHDFREHGELGWPNEYFLLIQKMQKINNLDLTTAIKRVENINKASNGIFSTKVMSKQIPFLNKMLEATVKINDKTTSRFPAFETRFKHAFWIRLIRQNKVRQAISRLLARQTGVYHLVDSYKGFEDITMLALKETNYDQQKLIYDAEKITQEIAEIKAEELRLENFLNDTGVKQISFYYEDITESPNYLGQITDELYLNKRTDLTRRILPLSSAINDEWAHRYETTHS